MNVAASEAPRAGLRSTYQVEVNLRPELFDAKGQAALALLHGAGLATAREVRAGEIYEIRGTLNAGQLQQTARDLLCDAVTQQYRILDLAGAPGSNGMNHWRVEVWLKESMDDPVARTLSEAFLDLGLPAPESLRRGLAYHVSGRCHRIQIEKAVALTLADPAIHRFIVSEARP